MKRHSGILMLLLIFLLVAIPAAADGFELFNELADETKIIVQAVSAPDSGGLVDFSILSQPLETVANTIMAVLPVMIEVDLSYNNLFDKHISKGWDHFLAVED
jgi:hypothetical protein